MKKSATAAEWFFREDRKPYYQALRAADIAWEQGQFDVSELAAYLSGLLKLQLSEA